MMSMLLYLLDNIEKMKVYGERARKKALDKYSIVKNIDLFVELYEGLIKPVKKEKP